MNEEYDFTSFQHERLGAETLPPADLARIVVEACERIRSAGTCHPPGVGVLMEAALRFVEQVHEDHRPVPGYEDWLAQELDDYKGCGPLIPHEEVMRQVRALILKIEQAGPASRRPYTLDDLGRPPGECG